MTGQICTPERAAVHAAINARITPAFASVGLLETCEQIAAYDADLRAQIAQLTAERDEARNALAALRRGMELQREAQPALTVEQVRQACIKARIGERMNHADLSRLHAALTQPPHAGKGVE